MKFYPENLKSIRKAKGISSSYLAEKLQVSRSTYWLWENGKREPSYENVIKLAELLKVLPSAISDIQVNSEKASPVDNSVISTELFSNESRRNTLRKRHDYALKLLEESNAEIDNLWSILDGIFTSLESILYIKDIKNKYVLANDSFRKTLSLKLSYSVLGKSDHDFYSQKSADRNQSEDKEILISGKKVNIETRTIPGTRNSKIGLVSKYPIRNMHDEITGLICIITDITELKRIEELRLLLEAIVNESTDATTIRDKKSKKLIFISQNLKDFLNILDRDISYDKQVEMFMEKVHPDDKSLLTKEILSERFQYRIHHENKWKWIDVFTFTSIYKGKEYICRIHRFMDEINNSADAVHRIIENMRNEGLSEELIKKIISNVI